MYSLPPSPARRAVRPSPIFLAFVAATVAGGVLAWQAQDLTIASVGAFIFVISGWVVSLSLHEFGHAYAAHRAGDTSIEGQGYLTLNPFRYAHPVLSVVLPLFFILRGGFGLPGGAVYLHPHTFRRNVDRLIAAAVGPATNLVLGVALLLATSGHSYSYHAAHGYFWGAVGFLGFLQLTAAVLNLLPVPGLDGYAMLEPYLQPATQRALAPFKQWGMIVIFAALSVQQLNAWFFRIVEDIYRLTGADVNLYRAGSSFIRFWNRQY